MIKSYPYTPPKPPANVNQGNVGVDIPGILYFVIFYIKFDFTNY